MSDIVTTRTAGQIALALFWFLWAFPFVFRAPHHQKRSSITVAGPTRIGLLLEFCAILMAFTLRLPPDYSPGWWRLIALSLIGPVGVVLAWQSVTHLGKQFRVHAGLYHDHELVRTGPYRLVRHPIYTSLLAMLVCTLLVFTPWQWAAISVALFVAGTEIRVRSEDALLESRFGEEFRRWQRKTPAYLPFVR